MGMTISTKDIASNIEHLCDALFYQYYTKQFLFPKVYLGPLHYLRWNYLRNNKFIDVYQDSLRENDENIQEMFFILLVIHG